MSEGTSTIIDVPETNTTTTPTSETVNATTNNEVRNEKSGNPTTSNEVRNDQGESNMNSNNGTAHLSKAKLILIMMGLAFGIFLAALDQTIVATALHAIATEFSALDQIAWVGTAYLLSATAFQPTYGKLADIFGRKITFLSAIFLFEVGSLICGLSRNMVCLIIARAIAGIGGGGIIGLVLIIISDIVSLKDRGKYQGMIGGVFGISSVVGPLLGGAFTDSSATWRWAFYINLPFGAITIITVILFLHLPHVSGSLMEKFKRLDWWGTLSIVFSTVALLLPLSWGGSKYEWDSPVIIVLLCVGALGIGVFALIERYVAVEPIAPGRLFKDRMVVACFAVNFFQGMSFFGMVYFVPLFFQIVKGTTATRAGIDLLPLIMGVVVSVIFSGQLVSRTTMISYKVFCVVGGILITVGAGLTTTFSEDSTRAQLVGYLLIAGIGIGSIMQTTTLASQQVVAYEDIAAVTSLLAFFRTIGAVFGLAIIGTVFTNELNKNVNKFSPGGNFRSKFSEGGLGNIPPDLRKLIINAFVSSFDVAFRVVIVTGALTFISALFMKNSKPARDHNPIKNDGSKEKETN